MTATFNRREFPACTKDFINFDHRKTTSIASGDLSAYLHATFELTPHASLYTEAVHRLNHDGAVYLNVGAGVSQDGFCAQWRVLAVAVVDGDLLQRYELFDAEDLDIALARFDEYTCPAVELENATPSGSPHSSRSTPTT